jgi:hypothetical protein
LIGDKYIMVMVIPLFESVESLRKLENKLRDDNAGTFPDIPVSYIFHHDMVYTEFDLSIDDALSQSDIPYVKVKVSDIAPTQEYVNYNNLLTTADISDDTQAYLLLEGGVYKIIDGHHRIANNILVGTDEIWAFAVSTLNQKAI